MRTRAGPVTPMQRAFGVTFLLALAVSAALAIPAVGSLSVNSRFSAPSLSPAENQLFTQPPFRVGDIASYAGVPNLTLRVGALERILDVGGVSVDAFPLFVNAYGRNHSVQHVSLRGKAIEAVDFICPVMDPGGCQPWNYRDWRVYGGPGALGAALVQGRAFQIGDEWVVTDPCRSCSSSRTVRIEAPTPGDEPGTVYILNLSVSYSTPGSRWISPAGRLQMGLAHAFPLVADLRGVRYTLTGFTPGGEAIPSPPSTPVSYPRPLAAQPFQDGLPVEGAPIAPYPSWKEARDRTALTAPPRPAGAQFTGLWIGMAASYGTFGSTRVNESVSYVWEQQTTVRDRADEVRTYSSTRPLPDTLGDMPVPWPWKVSVASERPTGLASSCATELVPLWDVVRYGLTLPYLTAFENFEVLSDCSAFRMVIAGASHSDPLGSGRSFSESLVVDIATGYLQTAVLEHWV